ncbi:hypothetical protein BUALT_Bualt12G0069200 [Buddleja alternifolia]|uniref:Expansin-like EG45 domain-containing protein n=1 Tax=Buddleja alternifolia TaxID=168488 RepID=A0AAV6WXS1_9LAMI|nr:hypothetical protein BUALT_Bualt12G0069200 [Buddleja alternifolia]
MKMCSTMGVLLMVTVASLSLAFVAYAHKGTATYYTPPYVREYFTTIIYSCCKVDPYPEVENNASACNGNHDEGTMIAAASDAIWEKGAACGKTYKVTCTGATNKGVSHPCTGQDVVVKIVDYCPRGCRGTIDLSQEAFSAIANTDAGKINGLRSFFRCTKARNNYDFERIKDNVT